MGNYFSANQPQQNLPEQPDLLDQLRQLDSIYSEENYNLFLETAYKFMREQNYSLIKDHRGDYRIVESDQVLEYYPVDVYNDFEFICQNEEANCLMYDWTQIKLQN